MKPNLKFKQAKRFKEAKIHQDGVKNANSME